MILRRFEVSLVGPDDYPADEGSAWTMEEMERKAIASFEEILLAALAVNTVLPEGFEVEIPGLSSGMSIPSGVPEGF